jgi:hypothetical protein
MDHLPNLVLPKRLLEDGFVAKLTPNQDGSLIQQGVRLRVALTSSDYAD